MPDLVPPSAFSLWLEEALTGWILPLGALALAGAAWGLYVFGFLPDGPAAAGLAVVVAVALALFMVRPAALWLLALLVAGGAAVLEVRLGKGNAAALAGMAVAYGLLVAHNATPETAVGTSLGAVLLGGLGGALGGGVLAMPAKLGPWKPALATVPAGGQGGKGGMPAGGGRGARGARPGAR